jgi:hypothetical protein
MFLLAQADVQKLQTHPSYGDSPDSNQKIVLIALHSSFRKK